MVKDSAICGIVAEGVSSKRWIISSWREVNSFCSFCPSFCPPCKTVELLDLTIFNSSFTCIRPGCSMSCGSNQCFSCQALRMSGNPAGTEVLAVANVETQNPLLFIISLILSRAFFCTSSCKTLSVSCTMRLLHSDRADEMPSR